MTLIGAVVASIRRVKDKEQQQKSSPSDVKRVLIDDVEFIDLENSDDFFSASSSEDDE